MSEKELDRLKILQQVINKNLTQRQAAVLLGISDRQIRKLSKKLKLDGPKSLISKKRGRISNHKKPKALKDKTLALLRERYEGFGPTFAMEKLQDNHQINLSVETIRLWMIESKLWITRSLPRRQVHFPRKRRACFGELIQIDGSHHHWFGDDNDPCVLTVFIDDATGTLTGLHFSSQETLAGYFEALSMHLKRYGKPRAFYSDRYAIFCPCKPTGKKTQFHRALEDLDIELILANSPQAKGRVERVNRTLQDRLLKELRLRNITSLDQANAYIGEFIKEYNKKFSKEPMSSVNAHRPLETSVDLDRILSKYEERTLSNSLLFQFHNTIYKLMEYPYPNRAKGKKIELRETKAGLKAFLNHHEVAISPVEEIEETIQVMDRKNLDLWKSKDRIHKKIKTPWRTNLNSWFKLRKAIMK